jgi:hypothetical protein
MTRSRTTTGTTTARALGALAGAGLLLGLTACGGGSGSTTATAPQTDPSAPASVQPASGDTSAPATPATPATAAADGSSSAIDVCAALPASDVSRITGTHYTKTKSSSTMGQIFGCEYTNAQYAILQVSVAVENGSLDFDTDKQVLGQAGFTPDVVTGVGDEAFSLPAKGDTSAMGASMFASYGALFGSEYVKIGGSPVTADQGRQLVEELHAAG